MEEEFIHVKVKDALNNGIIESYDYIVCPKCNNKKNIIRIILIFIMMIILVNNVVIKIKLEK